MQIEREVLLNQLESIKAGLSPREIIEQSSCFVFDEGKVMTYNDEIACSQDSCLKIKGAVQAEPLIAVLSKLPNDVVDIEMGEGELRIKAGARNAGVRMEAEVLLPIDSVEKPKKWNALPENFGDAIYIVSQCAGKDESQFVITCVHITSEFVEACDNYQLSRYPIGIPIKNKCLVRAASLKHICDLDMTEFAETRTWLHFRNPAGLVLSCRKAQDDYPTLDSHLDVSGSPTTLPKGLAEATAVASIFSSENADNDDVMINLSPKKGGMLRIKGEGASGWYTETKRIKYSGPAMKFVIAPKLFTELTKRHNECVINQNQLAVNTGKFIYVTSLGDADA